MQVILCAVCGAKAIIINRGKSLCSKHIMHIPSDEELQTELQEALDALDYCQNKLEAAEARLAAVEHNNPRSTP